MIEQKYIDLMNQELDGANTSEQSRELENYLSGHAEARAYYGELAQALDVFQKADSLDPPAWLGESILARVERKAAPAESKPRDREGRSLLAACRDLFRPRLEPAYAFTFLAGLAFGVALFAGSSWLANRHGTALYDDVRGTANHGAWNLEQVAEGELALPGIVGMYRTMKDGELVKLRLKLRSQQPAVLTFSHGPQTTLQHFNSDNPATARVEVSPSQVELNHLGRGSYDLVFRQDAPDPAAITMSVFSEGRLVKTETLELDGK